MTSVSPQKCVRSWERQHLHRLNLGGICTLRVVTALSCVLALVYLCSSILPSSPSSDLGPSLSSLSRQARALITWSTSTKPWREEQLATDMVSQACPTSAPGRFSGGHVLLFCCGACFHTWREVFWRLKCWLVAARLLPVVTNRSLLSLDVILTLLDGLQYYFFCAYGSGYCLNSMWFLPSKIL